MTKMTLYQFNALSFEDQLSSVWNQGPFLLVRPIGRSRLCLYSIGNFYVEIRLTAATYEITACRGFLRLHNLDPYLQLVNLEITTTDHNAENDQ